MPPSHPSLTAPPNPQPPEVLGVPSPLWFPLELIKCQVLISGCWDLVCESRVCLHQDTGGGGHKSSQLGWG